MYRVNVHSVRSQDIRPQFISGHDGLGWCRIELLQHADEASVPWLPCRYDHWDYLTKGVHDRTIGIVSPVGENTHTKPCGLNTFDISAERRIQHLDSSATKRMIQVKDKHAFSQSEQLVEGKIEYGISYLSRTESAHHLELDLQWLLFRADDP